MGLLTNLKDMHPTEILYAKAPVVRQYRDAKNFLAYVESVLSGQFGQLEPSRRKEYEATKADTIANISHLEDALKALKG